MPLYEYRCEACGAKEERLQGIAAPERHDCPECEASLGMRRQLSVAAFSLAGGGWYRQGYGGGAGKTAGDAKPAEGEAAKPAAADSKPAAGCAGGCSCHGSPG